MAKEILKEFFIEDNKLDNKTGKRRISTYLTIKRDLKKIMVGNKKNLGLSLLTNISLVCTCVDLLSKVSIGRQPKTGENGKIFKQYLKSYCDFSDEQSESLWKLRNSILHSFTIDSIKGIVLYGDHTPVLIKKSGKKKTITFFARALYSQVVILSAEKLRDHLLNEIEDTKPYEKYLLRNGFFYRSN
ncbi:MAG TPA: hypothetical protein P5136_07250 [Methanofastidiosum sp.]|nr:hypothetical protein [Methanofastidiosum sp.]